MLKRTNRFIFSNLALLFILSMFAASCSRSTAYIPRGHDDLLAVKEATPTQDKESSALATANNTQSKPAVVENKPIADGLTAKPVSTEASAVTVNENPEAVTKSETSPEVGPSSVKMHKTPFAGFRHSKMGFKTRAMVSLLKHKTRNLAMNTTVTSHTMKKAGKDYLTLGLIFLIVGVILGILPFPIYVIGWIFVLVGLVLLLLWLLKELDE